jgi:queuine/archaeosine tRNA-ribosyltransferase
MEAREVVVLGYDMVLGNTFHLLLDPDASLSSAAVPAAACF